MKITRAALILLLASANAFASDRYGQYADSVRHHQIPPGLSAFAQECGVTLEGQHPVYGVNLNDKWKLTKDPTRSSADEATDFFSTAEIWKQGETAAVVNIWSVGGDELNLKYCLGGNGKVRFIESENVLVPDDPSVVGWIYERRLSVDAAGKITLVRSQFRNLQGQKIATPNMEPDYTKSIHELPDINLPAQIRTAILPSRR